jgi:hypothetical protein
MTQHANTHTEDREREKEPSHDAMLGDRTPSCSDGFPDIAALRRDLQRLDAGIYNDTLTA